MRVDHAYLLGIAFGAALIALILHAVHICV